MKKTTQIKHNYFIMTATSILLMLCIIGIALSEDTGDGEIVEHEEISVILEEGSVSVNDEISEKTDEPEKTENTEQADEAGKTEEPEKYKESEIPYELESFGKYLELLYREGRRTELDDRIISEIVDHEKAAALAGKSPLLEHLGKKAEGKKIFATYECYAFTADVNGDGVEDVVEYGPYGEIDGVDTCVVVIYLGMEGGGFTLSCSKPIFPIASPQFNDAVIIDIVEYGGEAYLLFRWGYDSSNEHQGRVTAYWISDGMLNGKLELNWECQDIEVTVTEREDGYNVGFLVTDRMRMYHAVNNEHCNIDLSEEDLWWDRCGGGEIMSSLDWKEENEEADKALWDGYVKKYTEEKMSYLEKYDEEIDDSGVYVMVDMYESDLNNDGITEKYVKKTGKLWLCDAVFWYSMRPFITGEYYGVHEGRQGLIYYMESGGEETDFLKICGLDIWGGEMTPQNFWVEKTEKGNVTYIAYQDGEEHRQLIEGYLIKGDEYERVVSAWYIPEIECSIDYMPVDEPEGVGYVVYRSKDAKSFEMKWGESNDKEEMINRRIRELLEEAMGTIDLQGGKLGNVGYEPKEAEEEKFVADCTIYYSVPWREGQDEERFLKDFRICIDTVTGECEGIYDKVRDGSPKNEYHGAQYNG